TALSSGPGGQYANKANTKVILEWKLRESKLFSEKEMDRLEKKLTSYLTKEGVLQLNCEETRRQHRNKAKVTQRSIGQINVGIKKKKKRKRPKPGRKFHKKRLEQKRLNAEKKERRKNPLQ